MYRLEGLATLALGAGIWPDKHVLTCVVEEKNVVVRRLTLSRSCSLCDPRLPLRVPAVGSEASPRGEFFAGACVRGLWVLARVSAVSRGATTP